MPVIRPPARVKPKVSKNNGDISDQLAKSDFEIEAEQAKSSRERRTEKIVEQAKNQAEVKQAVNEAQQIADTLKQSKQTANSYTVTFKPVKFKPVVYIQNHAPKETNYETNYGSGESTTNNYVALALLAVCAILGFMIYVLIDKFVQWIKRKLKQCFKLFCSFCGIKLKGSEKNNNTDQNGKSGWE